MDDKKIAGQLSKAKLTAGKPNGTKSANVKSGNGKDQKWWSTPRTQAFIEAREALEVAYDELTHVEAHLRTRIEQRIMCRHRNHNVLLQSLTHECVQFLVRQEMAKSSDWQAAWESFSVAVIAAEAATSEFRDEIETATGGRNLPQIPHKACQPDVSLAQAAAAQVSRKSQSKARHSA